MSSRSSSNTRPKRKLGAQDESTSQRKKQRPQENQLVVEAQSLKKYLQKLLPPRKLLEVAVDGIIKNVPYTELSLNVLEVPIVNPEESPDPLIAEANEQRVKLANLYRSVFEELPGPMSPVENEDPFRDRRSAVKYGVDALSPSDGAKIKHLESEQANHPMKIGRPFSMTGPPISIYHPVFSKFRALISDQTAAPSATDVVTAHDLIEHASAIHKDEDARVTAVLPRLESLLCSNIGKVCSKDYNPDGVIFYDRDGAKGIPILVMEAKNEIGTGSSDPDVQGAFSFRKIWVEEKLSGVRNACCCPSFVLSMAGPHLAIHGAILADEFVVQPLTEILGLANFPDPVRRAQYVAKVLTALRCCLEDLKTFYEQLTLADDPQPACRSPVFQRYSKDGEYTLEYTSGNLLSSRIGRAMFNAKAKRPDDQEAIPVKVKFTTQYCQEAHETLAAQNLAPKLRHYEDLEDGWVVVVMDSVAGRDLGSAGPESITSRVLKDVEDALRLLHQNNWVFGDLRPPNIMLCELSVPGGTEKGAMLVDFDWAGKDGEQRYPPSLNSTITWPEGVVRGGLIEKQHDVVMFRSLSSGN